MSPEPDGMMHLNLLLLSYGAHWGAWRLPDAPVAANTDLGHFQALASEAERAAFDSVFVADIPGLLDNRTRPLECLDPTVLLASLTAVTSRIGLISTISTTYSDPYDVARKLASLDHLSRGRAGWNVVTGDYPQATANFPVDPALDHGGRYRRAHEFIRICTALWDSWEDGALVDDKRSGVHTDHRRIRSIDHAGNTSGCAGRCRCPGHLRDGPCWPRPAPPTTAVTWPRATANWFTRSNAMSRAPVHSPTKLGHARSHAVAMRSRSGSCRV